MTTRGRKAARGSLTPEEAKSPQDLGLLALGPLHLPVLLLWPDLHVRLANRAFLDRYGLEPANVERKPLQLLTPRGWDVARLVASLERSAVRHHSMPQTLEFETEPPRAGQPGVRVRIQTIGAKEDSYLLITMEDLPNGRLPSLNVSDTEDNLRAEVETALHDTKAALDLSREQLRALTAGLLEAQEEERRHVSRELHDSLGQKVAKLQFDIETLAKQRPSVPDGLNASLLSIRDEVAGLADDLRGLAHRLHPSSLQHLGLPVALRSYVREVSQREGLEVHIRIRGAPHSIPMEIATALYRVVQEALRNVVKHAGKASASVLLEGSSRQLQLTVRDTGPGFDLDTLKRSRGLGFISMQERVRLVRGDFTLKTRPGRGVTISIRVPLKAQS
ncbi:MAG: sensor histidine kinase [Bryobacteraceae bacterium]|nr:sensor histidine kinase [Bryobacteraceae bacterium]